VQRCGATAADLRTAPGAMDRKRAAAPAPVATAAAAKLASIDRDSDASSYDEERDRFVKDLRRFHDARG